MPWLSLSFVRCHAPDFSHRSRRREYRNAVRDSYLSQSQMVAIRITANTYPMGSDIAQSATAITAVRATFTRIGHRSRQSANMPRVSAGILRDQRLLAPQVR